MDDDIVYSIWKHIAGYNSGLDLTNLIEYKVMGQATFRYSDKWVAKTITTTGRLTLKISQICGDLYLKHQANN